MLLILQLDGFVKLPLSSSERSADRRRLRSSVRPSQVPLIHRERSAPGAVTRGRLEHSPLVPLSPSKCVVFNNSQLKHAASEGSAHVRRGEFNAGLSPGAAAPTPFGVLSIPRLILDTQIDLCLFCLCGFGVSGGTLQTPGG